MPSCVPCRVAPSAIRWLWRGARRLELADAAPGGFERLVDALELLGDLGRVGRERVGGLAGLVRALLGGHQLAAQLLDALVGGDGAPPGALGRRGHTFEILADAAVLTLGAALREPRLVDRQLARMPKWCRLTRDEPSPRPFVAIG